MNKKGLTILGLVAIFLATGSIFVLASKRHHQQRIEKQATVEGQIEYPMK